MEKEKYKNTVAVVIPFYNEEDYIEKIIEQTLKYSNYIIAVNDGSTDNSIKNIKSDNRIILINLEKNCGKGYALNRGFEKAIELGIEFTVTLDADLQHDPLLIPIFFNAIKDFDIIIGKRNRKLGVMPIQRIMSNKLTSYLLSKKTGEKILDSQCGYRLYRTNILKPILPNSNGFEAESEIIINAAKKNLKIGFVDIPTIYANEKSKMKSLEAIKGFLRILTQ